MEMRTMLYAKLHRAKKGKASNGYCRTRRCVGIVRGDVTEVGPRVAERRTIGGRRISVNIVSDPIYSHLFCSCLFDRLE
jgi:hypothetical protein